eukprot:2973848-Amphidinium_carterae.2
MLFQPHNEQSMFEKPSPLKRWRLGQSAFSSIRELFFKRHGYIVGKQRVSLNARKPLKMIHGNHTTLDLLNQTPQQVLGGGEVSGTL